jgi:hypothetical protein
MLLGLLCVVSTGTAWAQTPTSTPPAVQPRVTVLSVKKAASPAPEMQPTQPVSGGRLFAGPACGTPKCAAPACCATPTKTICVPETVTKVVVKINYSSICDKICYPKCSPFSHGCNSGCDQRRCEGHAYQKNYLVKRISTTECPTTNCVPVCVPVCETGRCGVHCPAPAKVETIPAPKKK